MKEKIRRWFIHTLVGTVLGFILGYTMIWIWFFFTLFILGYGDSGPSWVNTVIDVVFWGGMAIGILGGQILFFSKVVKKDEKVRMEQRK